MWKWDRNDDLRDEHDNAIVEGANYFGEDEDKAIDHKNVIAVAPELLRSLKLLERMITELYPGHVEPELEYVEEYRAVWKAVMDARAVIARAEGR